MSLFYPMGFYIFYLWCLICLNFFVRKNAVINKEMSIKYFKTYTGDIPEKVLVYGRHIDNQFQLPPIFLITCLSLHVSQVTSTLTVALAWGFVFSRLVHSYIHLGTNHLLRRATVYAIGWIFILSMWTVLFLNAKL